MEVFKCKIYKRKRVKILMMYFDTLSGFFYKIKYKYLQGQYGVRGKW